MVPGWYAHDWSPSPGWSRVKDAKTWPKLRQYVEDVLARFKDDPRVLMWDLYNEPTNGIGDATLPLLAKVVDWARQVNPSQPLTIGVWSGNPSLNDLATSHSDIITFHRYSNAAQLDAFIRSLQKHDRPLICTEWLKRNWGSVGDQLPVFVRHRVGCLHWGLVNGKTQTQYPWGSKAGAPEPKVWQHDLFRKDRTPYDPHEIELFKKAIAQSQRGTADTMTGPQNTVLVKIRAMLQPWHPFQEAWAANATLIFKATYAHHALPCIWITPSVRVRPLGHFFEVTNIVQGEVKFGEAICHDLSREGESFPNALVDGRSYLVFLKPGEGDYDDLLDGVVGGRNTRDWGFRCYERRQKRDGEPMMASGVIQTGVADARPG